MSRANDMAFPVPSDVVTPNNTEQLGLTVREHFAAMAMQGLLTDPSIQESSEDIAARAVVMADALLAELGKDKS